MKRVCAFLLCILSFSGLMLRKTLADQRTEDHAALTIAQAGATTFEEMQYIGENPEVDVEIRTTVPLVGLHNRLKQVITPLIYLWYVLI